jgi:hypothetical protein
MSNDSNPERKIYRGDYASAWPPGLYAQVKFPDAPLLKTPNGDFFWIIGLTGAFMHRENNPQWLAADYIRIDDYDSQDSTEREEQKKDSL